ncbi:MAG: hypothetical protein AAF378_25230 [Cyanobacteria bacterium P01_A01_bin.84]
MLSIKQLNSAEHLSFKKQTQIHGGLMSTALAYQYNPMFIPAEPLWTGYANRVLDIELTDTGKIAFEKDDGSIAGYVNPERSA